MIKNVFVIQILVNERYICSAFFGMKIETLFMSGCYLRIIWIICNIKRIFIIVFTVIAVRKLVYLLLIIRYEQFVMFFAYDDHDLILSCAVVPVSDNYRQFSTRNDKEDSPRQRKKRQKSCMNGEFYAF